VTTGLIVLGVIAFLAIDGYVLYRVLRSRRTADEVAVVAVPGEAAMMLSPGTGFGWSRAVVGTVQVAERRERR
jgi:hypothetical protein